MVRGDPTRRRWSGWVLVRLVGALLLVAAWPGLAGAAQANRLCETLGIFQGEAFRLLVVDAETQRPLANVHALAEWQSWGFHGRNGPVMVQDAVSGADGILAFPAWGPVSGERAGLVLNSDPVITLFKPGYKPLIIFNAYPEDMTETTCVRRFGQDGRPFALEPFRGTPDEWVEQLRKISHGLAGPRSREQSLRFRDPYVNRLRLIRAERDHAPSQYREPGQFFWHVERDIKFYEEGRR